MSFLSWPGVHQPDQLLAQPSGRIPMWQRLGFLSAVIVHGQAVTLGFKM